MASIVQPSRTILGRAPVTVDSGVRRNDDVSSTARIPAPRPSEYSFGSKPSAYMSADEIPETTTKKPADAGFQFTNQIDGRRPPFQLTATGRAADEFLPRDATQRSPSFSAISCVP